MPLSRSLIIVNYRSASHTAEAIRTARASSTEPLEVVVVDNSDDPSEVERLGNLEIDLLVDARGNLGYAKGINLGVSRSTGELLVICNPDVRFGAASIDMLIGHAEADLSLAGPAFSWDDGHDWMMPPSQQMTRMGKMDSMLAGLSKGWANARRRRRLRNRIRFWSRTKPEPFGVVSGAAFAVSRATFEKIGGFDERFFLYFEEVDFMRRLRDAGGKIVYEPGAHCRHIYSQSATDHAESALLFHRSERLFHEKWHGRLFAKLIAKVDRSAAPTDPIIGTTLPLDLPPGMADDYLVEVSLHPNFDMSVGYLPDSSPISIPLEIWESYGGDGLFVRIVRKADLEVLAAYGVRRPEGSGQ